MNRSKYFVEWYLHGRACIPRHAKGHLTTECPNGRFELSINTSIKYMDIHSAAVDSRFIFQISHQESE